MSEHKATKTAAGKGKVVDKNGFSVCSCSGGTYADTVKRAEMIALALNNHEKLVWCLELCASILEDGCPDEARTLLDEISKGESNES